MAGVAMTSFTADSLSLTDPVAQRTDTIAVNRILLTIEARLRVVRLVAPIGVRDRRVEVVVTELVEILGGQVVVDEVVSIVVAKR